MIRLDTVNRKLQIKLAGAITTNQLPVTVSYADKTTTAYNGGTQLSNTNSTTAVDICSAPPASVVRDIDYINIVNTDTNQVTVTVSFLDSATVYGIVSSFILAVGQQLTYIHGTGWVATSGAYNAAAAVHGAASKSTPVDADELSLADSASSFSLFKLTWANLKTTLKTYLDTLYAGRGANTDITSLSGVTSINGSYPSGYKNKIIGGDFTTNPWQRATSFAAAGNQVYTTDRWRWSQSGTGVVTINKAPDAPTPVQAGLFTQHSLNTFPTTAAAALAAGDFYFQSHLIEGFNAASFGFGQAGARNVTLSFWVKGTKTGIHCVALRNSTANRSYVAEYTIITSNTWEYKTITIPVDVAGTWLYGTGIGVEIDFTLAAGTTFQTPAGAWTAGNFIASANQVNEMDAITNVFRIALVQLEAGSTATPFETRSEGQELTLCQRYYQQLSDMMVNGNSGAASVIYNDFPLPVPMRSTPTGTVVGAVTYSNASAYGFNGIAPDKFRLNLTITATGYGYGFGAKLTFNAEL